MSVFKCWLLIFRFETLNVFTLHYGERYSDLVKGVCSLEDGNFVIHHYHPCTGFNCEACKLNSKSKQN